MPVTMKSGRGGRRVGAGRKSGWKEPKVETITVRVPKYLAEKLVSIARELDYDNTLDFATYSNAEKTLASIKELIAKWRSRSSPTSTRWEKANILLKELEDSLGIAPEIITREMVGRTEFFGEVQYNPLKESQLAFRLGVPDSTLGNNRAKPETLIGWTRDKDPNGIGWEYRIGSKMYFPVDLIT
jgi:hypothetical protein